jgi:hypothetical protein
MRNYFHLKAWLFNGRERLMWITTARERARPEMTTLIDSPKTVSCSCLQTFTVHLLPFRRFNDFSSVDVGRLSSTARGTLDRK